TPAGAGEPERDGRERQDPPDDQGRPGMAAGPRPTPGLPKNGVYPLGLEPPPPPADRAERAEQDGADGDPRVAGRQEQEDLGAEPDLGVGGPAVVGEGGAACSPRGAGTAPA